MGFSVRFLKEDDYEVLCQWWKAWRWTAPPRDFLPENGMGGLMVEKSGIPIVAGFVYFTNSAVAWSEFIISNFDYKDKDRKEAIKILIIELAELAKRNGSKYIYTVVKNQNLKKAYQEIGFTDGSVKVDEMVMVL
jgi:hypothetical protein